MAGTRRRPASRSSASRSSGSSKASSRASSSRSAPAQEQSRSAEPAKLDKESLVERLTAQLRKLKKDELVSLVERAEAGTLDFTRLTTSGEGGFGFQENLANDEGGGGERGAVASAVDAAKDVVGRRRGGNR